MFFPMFLLAFFRNRTGQYHFIGKTLNPFMVSFLLLSTLFIDTAQAMETVENADDICFEDLSYNARRPFGVCVDFGIVQGGINCQQNIPLKNQDPDHPLTDVTIALDTSMFSGSFLGDCGIDDGEGNTSCTENQLIDFGPVDMFQDNITYNLDTMDIGDSDTIWEYALMSMAIFNYENLYGSYVKDGKRYRGEIHACTNNINNDYRPFSLRHRELIHGNMMTIGNTILVAPVDQSSDVCSSYKNGAYKDDTSDANDAYELCAYYDDTSVSFPTTTAELPIPSGDDVEVVWAGLYWQSLVEDSYNIENMSIKIKHDKSDGYETVDFDQLDWMKDVGKEGYISYSAFKDVTYLFQNNNWKDGNITVGDIPVAEGKVDNLGTYGAWTLVVMYKKKDEKFRAMQVYDGWQQVDSDHAEVDIPISDFLTPKATPISAEASVFAAEGDKYIENDYLKAKPSRKTVWTDLSHTTNQTFYSAINTPVRFTRSPSPSNNQGIDIQTFNLGTDGYDIIEPNETAIEFKFGSDQDRYWPSMISFSAELRAPDLCYDYAYKQGNRYFTEENDGSKDPKIKGLLFSNEPIEVSLFLKNREKSDLVLKNIEMKVDNIDTVQASYIDNSVKYIPAGSTQEETPSSVSSSESFVHASVGGLGSEEHLYFYYDLDPKIYAIDMPIDASIEYDMVITVPDTGEEFTFHYDKQDLDSTIPLCVDDNYSYAPVYGTFNVEEAGLGDYNIFTQVAKRVDAFEVKSYTDAQGDGEWDDPLPTSTIVAVELVDMGAYHETKTSCEEPINTLTPRVWILFDNNVSSVNFDIQNAIDNGMVSDQILNQADPMTDASDFYAFVRRNVAFRVSYNDMGDGEIPLVQKENNGEYTIINWRTSWEGENCAQDMDGNPSNEDKVAGYCNDTGNNPNDIASCMECVYGKDTRMLCSRDNFAIRPKAFKVSMSDDNTSIHSIDFANNTDKAGSSSSLINVVAGYPYRFDINATDYTDGYPVSGYIQSFDSSDPNKYASMLWKPVSITADQALANCNTPADRNMTFSLINGTNTNPSPINTWNDLHDTLDNVGEYEFVISDKEWTKYDWDSNLTRHHDIRSHFIASTTPDCISDDNSVPESGKVGCETTSDLAPAYSAVHIRSYPYTFDVTPLSYGARPSNNDNDNTWVYMYTMDKTQYPNGVDANMSYNIHGVFKVVGYNNAPVDNFVSQCYAQDVDMNLIATYISNQAEAPAFGYDLIDINSTDSSIVYRPRENNNSLAYDTNIGGYAIGQDAQYFKKDMKAAIDMDLGYNFNRSYNIPSNPVYIAFKDFNLTLASQPSSLQANGKSTYEVFGNMDLDQNVTFIYGRAKPSKYFYDDVTANSVTTPISVEVYCDLGYTTCQNLGIDTVNGQTGDAYWWRSTSHDNVGAQDGNIILTTTHTSANVSSPVLIPSSSKGVDSTVTVSYTGDTRPTTVNIDFGTDSATGSYTDRWLIYNKDANSVPTPFYRVRFIGTGSWAGEGQTGHVVGGESNKKKSRRLEW